MKNLKLFLLSAVVAGALSSCSHEPKACFTVQVFDNNNGKYVESTKGKVGETFSFSPMCSVNNFGGATEFEYGDGTKGSEGHTYAKPGTYTVKCKVYATEHGQKGEKTDEATQTVTVLPSEARASL